MAQKDLGTLSLEELHKQRNTLKTATIVLLILLFIMALSGIYLTCTKGFSVFSVLVICFIPLVLINVTNFKKINLEIEKRK